MPINSRILGTMETAARKVGKCPNLNTAKHACVEIRFKKLDLVRVFVERHSTKATDIATMKITIVSVIMMEAIVAKNQVRGHFSSNIVLNAFVKTLKSHQSQ